MAKKSTKSNGEYTRNLNTMQGICSGENSQNKGHGFKLLENMYIDYSGSADALESVPGFRKLLSFGLRINGIFKQKISSEEEFLIVHAGTYVYRLDKNKLENTSVPSAIAQLRDAKSSAFRCGEDIYLIDGEHLVRIDGSGSAFPLGTSGAVPYIPTLFSQGKKYEERNLLCESGKEVFTLNDYTEYMYGSPGLKYIITENNCCTLIGCTLDQETVHIPSYTKIENKYYKVTSVAPYAFFGNTAIKKLFTNPELKTIGAGAFKNCTSLNSAVIANTVENISEECFRNCSSLVLLILNRIPEVIDAAAFLGCDTLTRVNCGEGIENFALRADGSGLESKTPVQITPYTAVTVGFKLQAPFIRPTEVSVEGHNVSFEYDSPSKTLSVTFVNESEFTGKEITIFGNLLPYDPPSLGDSFLSTEIGKSIGGRRAILGCSICECFDGRIFLSGNPELPGVVFYSETDKSSNSRPLYFAVCNFFTDGMSVDKVSDLLATNGRLAVFKAGDDGSGTVFCHEPKTVDEKTKYPVSHISGSIPVIGGAVNFFDEPIFLTRRGACALEKARIGDYREIRCRSESISALLCKEDLQEACITEWLGYLVICLNGKLYLADSRDTYTKDGVLQYEWYRLSGIGTYKNDRRLYRYSSVALGGYELSDTPDRAAEGVVMSELAGSETVYFVYKDGRKIRVYPTEEFVGGEFDPAVTVFADAELLYFGTKGGNLCIFNNDKRGVPPSELLESDGFSPEEYKAAMGDKIHPSFYTFGTHRADYRIVTNLDNCDIPALSKSSVRDSLVIKFKSFEGSCVNIETETDNGERKLVASVPLSKLSFDGLSFDSLTSSVSDFFNIKLPEYERGWTEKRYLISSDGFASPFGIRSLSFRYRVKGNIKN